MEGDGHLGLASTHMCGCTHPYTHVCATHAPQHPHTESVFVFVVNDLSMSDLLICELNL